MQKFRNIYFFLAKKGETNYLCGSSASSFKCPDPDIYGCCFLETGLTGRGNSRGAAGSKFTSTTECFQ